MRQQLRFTEEISIFERAGQERMEGEEAPSHRPRLGPELSWTYSTSCPTDESRSGEDGGRGGSKPQAQTGPRTELDVLYKLSHRRRRRSRRRGKRRRRRTRGTGGGGGGGGGGGERRKRGSFRQTQRTKKRWQIETMSARRLANSLPRTGRRLHPRGLRQHQSSPELEVYT
ncbi:eukaryotic translation initiation factor 3 subunit A-like [Etheostoma spectabile]|uniref:eukaryotic translation initiation factor 3 subunit A-like n=1 Tax=Etheostoma spectabile TaxID=54343 RepID=UPI0013AE9239|nr:eukaryotic translation initiation factor 3 subunit A-like [Etheostoma spectabile]